MGSGEMDAREYVAREGLDEATDDELRELTSPAAPFNLERALFVGSSVTGPHVRPPDDDELGGGWARLIPRTPSGSGGQSGDMPPSYRYDSPDVSKFAQAA